MLDFQAVKTTLEQANLSHEEWEQVALLVNQRRHEHVTDAELQLIHDAVLYQGKPAIAQNSPDWFSGLVAGLADFWEGMTPDEIQEIVSGINAEDDSDKAVSLFDNLADFSEHDE